MGLPNTVNQLFNGGSPYYIVNRSLRFRASASAYLNRTPASAGNRKTWTWSGWIKRGLLGSNTYEIFAGDNWTTSFTAIRFVGDVIYVQDYLASPLKNIFWQTVAVLRDPSAWYHIVVKYDTTQASSTNAVAIYINGVSQTLTFTAVNGSYVQNYDGIVNSTFSQKIGWINSQTTYLDGYLAEVNFIDGQALTPSSFGIYDSNGIWQPIKYTGTYGTNGFYLPFSNASLNTLLSNASNISAPFGGVATNALVADGVYCISNTSTGSTFTFLLNDFGTATQVTRYNIVGLSFTGGASTFSIQGSPDNSTWTTFATLSVTSTGQNFSGSLNGNFRYWRLAPTSFGTNGQASVDQFVLYQDGIGLDYSGNGNNWTPNNISLTAGSTYDSMIDSPTVSATASNYAVLNPLDYFRSAPIDGNLGFSLQQGAGGSGVGSTISINSGKWYWETVCSAFGGSAAAYTYIGMTLPGDEVAPFYGLREYIVHSSGVVASAYGTVAANGFSYAANDVIQIAYDADAGKIWYGKNGTWSNSGVPSSGTNPNVTGVTGRTLCPAVNSQIATAGWYANGSVNFGQRPFSYTPPSGYNALNTANLPQPLISNGANYMAATLYTGNGSTQTINNGTNTTIGTSFQPDFVWIKNRAAAVNHQLQNSNAGWQYGLNSNNTNAEYTDANAITGATSSGWSMNNNYNSHNQSGVSYVGWNWKAGAGTTSTNTSGSITSTVSVSAQSGFSVVLYTGNSTIGATVGHGLGVAPNMIILKPRNAAGSWIVYHSSYGNTGGLVLNLTNAAQNQLGWWNNTSPSSTVFTLGGNPQANYGDTNYNYNYVAYCFAAVRDYSAMGSYTGNGSSDGPFNYCGFRPRWLMVKSSTTAHSWEIYDTSRDPYNVAIAEIDANSSAAEYTAKGASLDFLSNGFKVRYGSSGFLNVSGQTYVWVAFAESPFQIARAR